MPSVVVDPPLKLTVAPAIGALSEMLTTVPTSAPEPPAADRVKLTVEVCPAATLVPSVRLAKTGSGCAECVTARRNEISGVRPAGIGGESKALSHGAAQNVHRCSGDRCAAGVCYRAGNLASGGELEVQLGGLAGADGGLRNSEEAGGYRGDVVRPRRHAGELIKPARVDSGRSAAETHGRARDWGIVSNVHHGSAERARSRARTRRKLQVPHTAAMRGGAKNASGCVQCEGLYRSAGQSRHQGIPGCAAVSSGKHADTSRGIKRVGLGRIDGDIKHGNGRKIAADISLGCARAGDLEGARAD